MSRCRKDASFLDGLPASVKAANPHIFNQEPPQTAKGARTGESKRFATTPARTLAGLTAVAGAPARMNRTEAEYHHMLKRMMQAGEYTWVSDHEAFKVRIGEKRCWYTVDFAALHKSGVLELHEVKGAFVYDDARVKFQAAKMIYHAFKWVWAQKIEGVWKIQ